MIDSDRSITVIDSEPDQVNDYHERSTQTAPLTVIDCQWSSLSMETMIDSD
jgi:hypothetical protein